MVVFCTNYLKENRKRLFRPCILLTLFGLYNYLIVPVTKANVPEANLHITDNDMQLYLELVINEQPTYQIVAIDVNHDNYYIALSDLETTGISQTHWQTDATEYQGKINLNQVKGVKLRYDAESQMLFITVPPSWLPAQMINTGEQRTFNPPKTSFGALFNYDIYVNKPKHESGSASTWTELRVFGDYGALNNTGIYRQNFDNSNNNDNGYTRYDTRWEYADEELMLTLETGDFITRTPAWIGPVRLGGVQLSHNFAIRPDIITYPVPQFSGENSLPSTVDLFVDGYKTQSYNLNPGPFTLNNIPFINGAGTAVLVTKNALGQTISTEVPLYVTNRLLAKGLTDYSAGVGFLREDYGTHNFKYGDFAFNASLRYGLTNYLTLESHAEVANNMQVLGIGSAFRIGQLGVINAAYSQSHADSQDGHLINVGYQYINHNFSIDLQHTQSSNNYRDLANYQQEVATQSSTQMTLGLQLGNLGQLIAGYFIIKDRQNLTTKLINITWSRSLNRFGNLFLSISKANNENNWSGVLQWLIPFSNNNSTLTMSTTRDTNKKWAQRIGYDKAIVNDRGLSYNLSYQNNQGQPNYQQASIGWRDAHIDLNAGVYGEKNNETLWSEASGSLIFMENQLFAANAVPNSFAVVTTDHVPDIPVFYENSLVGHTDKNGYLLVTQPPAYYAGQYAIDTLSIANNLKAETIEQKVALKAKSGYLLRFPIEHIIPTYLTLVDEQGQYLPIGAQATLNGKETTYIGWDGFAYFENTQADNHVIVTYADDKTCTATFSANLNDNDQQPLAINPLVCH
ncbi:fimbria/pilus outer membrane usher protein [Utexia brackfieldae]|uniref:fimbria/pilus outer membrane usher protein n=1 Tax=Utexia brackfieldae TaxID=3074108 RepID=UPI00370DBFF0